jgi:deoxyadenosine/deoxycytidine kinase
MYCSPKRRIVIDGNIGSGKTTQLNLLSQKGYNVITEPIHEWPLELFYSDKSRWGLLLQLTILTTFNKYDGGLIYERSPHSSYNVFWKMLFDEGTVNLYEHSICTEMYTRYGWKPDVHIYIRTSPEKCYDRISKRCQEGDSSVSLEYLQRVNEYHEMYAIQDDTHIIDGDVDSPEKIHEQILHLIKDDMRGN